MLDSLLEAARSFKDRVAAFIGGLNGQRRVGLIGGMAMFGAAAMAGGVMLQYALGGVIMNSMFWLLIHESKVIMRFMRRYGASIDVVLTVGSFFTGGATVSGWLIGLMGTGFFTFFRMTICRPLTDEEKEAGLLARAWAWTKKKLTFKKEEAATC